MTDRDALLLAVKSANPVPGTSRLPAGLEESRPPLDLLIEERAAVDTTTSPAPSWIRQAQRWRGPIIAVAALLIVLVVALPLLFLRGDGDESPVATTGVPTPTTTVAATTVPPAPTVAPPTSLAGVEPSMTTAPTSTTMPPLPASLGMTWERLPDQEALENSWITGVVPGGPGLVAVGYEVVDFSDWDSNGAAWVSADGLVWERVDDPDLPSGEALLNVAAGPSGFVAVAFPASLLFSSDGMDWERIDDERFDGLRLTAVTAGGPGWVAVGGDLTTGDAVVMVSEDGVSWDRIEDDDLVGGYGSDALDVFDVASGGPGLVAVGFAGLRDSPTGAVWVSSDGLDWERIPDDAIGAAGMVGSVAADPGSVELVAFGRYSVWTSADGRAWVPSIDPESFPLEQPAVDAAASWDGDLIIAGGDDGVLWGSPDRGASWARIESWPAAVEDMRWPWISDIAQFGGRFVAVGGDAGSSQGDSPPMFGPDGGAAVWIGEWNE